MARVKREQEGTNMHAELVAYKACLESILTDTDPVEDDLESIKQSVRIVLDGWNIKTAKRWKA